MPKRILTLLALVALAFVLIFIFASRDSPPCPPAATSVAGELYAPDQILVRFSLGVSALTMARIHHSNGAVLIREIPQIGVQVLRVPSERVPQMVAAYSRNPNVLYAEPDYIAHALEDPDDSYFAKQWGLDNDGQAYKDSISGTVDADIDAPEAWDVTTGDPKVLIAILDTGIDQDHEDLDKIVANENFTDSVTVEDCYGHGTHVAGIAAGATNNGTGVAGVGYNSALMNGKVLNDHGFGYYSWIAEGILWAADHGAKVINMSLGSPFPSRTLEDAVNYAWDHGVVLACAAGNNGDRSPTFPAKYENCIAVAATDDDDARADFSTCGSWIDVAAPGVDIYSTFPNHPYAMGKSLNYGYASGTSMATPHVAGVAALVWAIPEYGTSNSSVRNCVEQTADPIEGTGDLWIHGRVNAHQAVSNCPSAPSS